MPRLARFYPELIHESRRTNPKLRGEVRFYDLLGEQLPAGWVVFYGVGWLGRRWRTGELHDGESDFILAHPTYGVLVVELKGGGIRFDGDEQQWSSTDAGGVTHAITNPFSQAKTGKHNLRERLADLLRVRKDDMHLCHAVAFPHCDRPADPITEEAKPEIIIGRQDLTDLAGRVRQILAHSLDRQPFVHGRDIVDGLVKLLARSATLPNPLRSQLADEQAEVQALTNSQIDLFRRLQKTRRLSVGGGAGSGKTYVAVHRARELARQGFRTLLVCHAAPLAAHLAELTAGEPNLLVASASDLARRFAPHLGVAGADADTTFPAALLDAVAGLCEPPFQAVLVDEGQDFTPDWFIALEACGEGGKSGVFVVFHDTNNQTLLPGRGVLPADLLSFELTENVRNTQAVCRVMRSHYLGEVDISPRGPEGRAVVRRPHPPGELGKALGGVLTHLLVNEGLPARDVVVLTPRESLAVSELPAVSLPNGVRLVTDPKAVVKRNVLVSTVADFKGLERPVVVTAELDDALPADPRRRAAALYVAFSRPRSLLYLLGSEAVLTTLG